jgi:hypothetical protein
MYSLIVFSPVISSPDSRTSLGVFKLVSCDGGMRYRIGSVFEGERSGFVEKSEETEGFAVWRKEESHFGQTERMDQLNWKGT